MPFNMMVGLGASNVIAESANNEVNVFIQSYVYHGMKTEGIVETRMRQHNEIKAKTVQTVLSNPNSLTQPINSFMTEAVII